MKITGDRMRTAKLTPAGDLAWDIPSSSIHADLKYIIEYDARPTGRIYHVRGKCFRNWRNAVMAALNG